MNQTLEEVRRSLQSSIGTLTAAQFAHELPRPTLLPTGVPGLDAALDGGWARGRVAEVYGKEASGKTSILLMACVQAQAAGLSAAFVDAEHALDPAWAKALGVDLSRLIVSQPDHGEQALDIVEALARSGAVGVVAIDSVAALVPQYETEGGMSESGQGLQARMMSKACRKLIGVAARTDTLLLFANQLRPVEGVTFGPSDNTEGGNALKYYASQRVETRTIGSMKSGETVIGTVLRQKIVKNKLAPPFTSSECELSHHGIWLTRERREG